MGDEGRAVFETFIRGTAEQVWREITKTDEPQEAFFNALMVTPGLAPGAPVQMRTPDQKYTSVVGEVLESDPPRLLKHTLKFTAYEDPHTTVTYRIDDAEGGVHFTLTVEGMVAGTKTAKSMNQGGPMICKVLKAMVENGKPPLWYRAAGVVFKVMGAVATPKKCRTDRWEAHMAGAGG